MAMKKDNNSTKMPMYGVMMGIMSSKEMSKIPMKKMVSKEQMTAMMAKYHGK